MHDIDLALEILLDGPHPALWDRQTEREALRFLRKRGRDISKKDLSRLIKAIRAGPPRERYSKELADEEWAERRDHQIRLRLHKIRESGAKLPKTAEAIYDRIQHKQPWQPPGDGSEEFPYFMSSGFRDLDDPGTMEDFAAMSVELFIRWTETQKGQPWDCGGGWHVFVENHPKSALGLLQGAAKRTAWPIPQWYTFLSLTQKAGSTSRGINREIAERLADMPLEFLGKLDLCVARWLEDVRKLLPKRLRQSLWRRVWKASFLGDPPEGQLDFDMTLNHAGGILANVLYSEMTDYIPRVGAGESPGLPRKLRHDFESIARDDSPSATLARVRLAPMLFILFRVDPDWTERALFSRMDLDDDASFDPHLWESYLWHARWSDDLLIAFKKLLFKVLRNLDRIPRRVRNHGAQLFVYMAVPPDRGISTAEAKGILYNMNPDNLADAAWVLRDMLRAAGKRSPALWRDTIEPWFNEVWPKRAKDRSKKLSEKLAWMAIDSGDAFPYVVRATEDLVGQEKWTAALYHLKSKEEEIGLIKRFPEAALTLADKLVGEQTQLNDATLRTTLDAIAAADSQLKDSGAFKRLLLRV